MIESSSAEPTVALPLVVTNAGREASVEASNAGLQLHLTEIALGRGLWEPDATATALQEEIKRLPNLGGSDVAPDMLHLTITDDSGDEYSLGEFGLYTDTGILFAIYSQVSWISEKVSSSILMLSADMKLDTVPPGSVTIEGNNFQYPPATPSSLGVIIDAPHSGEQYVRQSGHWAELDLSVLIDRIEALEASANQPGFIQSFAGTLGQIPVGWQLCNGEGETSNGIPVPDLTDRFILCAGADYAVGSVGGATIATSGSSGSHSHLVTVNSTTLSESQMPNHGHKNKYSSQYDGFGSSGQHWQSNMNTAYQDRTSTVEYIVPKGSSSSHTHSASSTATGEHSHTVSTLSPYYALAYIIKL